MAPMYSPDRNRLALATGESSVQTLQSKMSARPWHIPSSKYILLLRGKPVLGIGTTRARLRPGLLLIVPRPFNGQIESTKQVRPKDPKAMAEDLKRILKIG